MKLIEFIQVRKDYRVGQTDVRALDGVDLTIGREEFIAVVGPSGSGKSTLLNIAGTIDEPTSGKVLFEGQDLSTLSDDARTSLRNRKVGFVFQRFNLIPVLSALENTTLPLELLGEGGRKVKDHALALLREVGLEDFLHHRPDQLSGGQQQRVAIARALVTNPALVIADEPTANLDSTTSKTIIALMRRLNRQHHTTFVFSTHDPRLLDSVDRVVTLQDGRIEAQSMGKPNLTLPTTKSVTAEQGT